MNKTFAALLAVLALLLTGCADKVEVEERGYAGAIAIDKDERLFNVGVELLALKEPGGGDKDGGGGPALTQSGESVGRALKQINDRSAKRLNLGLAKACLLGAGLLGDPVMLREAVDALERDGEINNKLLVLAAPDTAADTLDADIGDELSLGFFISNYYTNNERAGGSGLRLDLEGLSEALAGDGSVLIPVLTVDDGPKISGAAALSGGKLTGWLTDDELLGLAWVTGKAKGTRVVVGDGCERAAFTAVKASSRLDFSDNGDGLACTVYINAEGTLESLSPPVALDEDALARLETLLAEAIADETCRTFIALRDLGADGYGLTKRLRKYEPELYETYGGDMNGITFTADVGVKITNTGSLK